MCETAYCGALAYACLFGPAKPGSSRLYGYSTSLHGEAAAEQFWRQCTEGDPDRAVAECLVRSSTLEWAMQDSTAAPRYIGHAILDPSFVRRLLCR